MRDKTLEEILQHFEDRLKVVKASTVAFEMNTFCGAESKSVPYPTAKYPPNLHVTRSLHFVQMKKRVEHLAREEDVDYPTPLEKEHQLQVLNMLVEQNETEAFFSLLIQWITAARPFCVYQLRPADIVFSGRPTSVLFRKGKGVTMRRSPYTVHTTAGYFSLPLQEFVENRMSESSLFDTEYAPLCDVIRTAMRTQEITYEMRSRRRGALCCMAEQGATLKTLRMFSGHMSNTTLLRYLGWGMSHGKGRKQAAKAARCLLKRENRLRRLRGQPKICFDWKVCALPSKKSGVTSEQMAWPLHAKDISLLSPRLYEDINSPIFQYLWDERRYASIHTCVPCTFPESTLSSEDIQVLCDRGIAEEIPLGEIPVGCVGIVFCVPECSKTRRRLVHDTLTPNVDPSVEFTPIKKLMKRVNHFKFAVMFDFPVSIISSAFRQRYESILRSASGKSIFV
jgi:hypothetical protein